MVPGTTPASPRWACARPIAVATLDTSTGEVVSGRLPGCPGAAGAMGWVARHTTGRTLCTYESGPTKFDPCRSIRAAGAGCGVAAATKAKLRAFPTMGTERPDGGTGRRGGWSLCRPGRGGGPASLRNRPDHFVMRALRADEHMKSASSERLPDALRRKMAPRELSPAQKCFEWTIGRGAQAQNGLVWIAPGAKPLLVDSRIIHSSGFCAWSHPLEPLLRLGLGGGNPHGAILRRRLSDSSLGGVLRSGVVGGMSS